MRKWYINFSPDRGMGLSYLAGDKGPFSSKEVALGWASLEMKGFPLSLGGLLFLSE